MSAIPSTSLSRRLAVGYALVVLVVSSLPGVRVPDLGEGHLDLLLHFTQYGVLGFLVGLGWGPRKVPVSTLSVWIPALILILFAAMDECHQQWVPGRFAEWLDWSADILGILSGYVMGIIVGRRAMRSQSPE